MKQNPPQLKGINSLLILMNMTFDEALDKIASQSEENKRLIDQAKMDAQLGIFYELAKEYGATITPSKDGKGHILIDGKEVGVKDFLRLLERT